MDDIYSKVQKSSIYTPINKVTSKYTQRTSEPTYDTPRDARIEDLYASVNARESDTLENAKAIAGKWNFILGIVKSFMLLQIHLLQMRGFTAQPN